MKLKEEIILSIRQNMDLRNALLYHLRISPSTLQRYMENKTDGDLTKMKALKIISSHINVPEDKLLEE